MRRALPSGYGLSLVGAVLFGVGGALDLVWHSLFGIEADVAALMSPTHLLLIGSATLIATGPLRAAWRRPTRRVGWPAVLSATLLLSVLRHGLTVAGRYLVLRSRLGDRPGELIRFLEIVANTRANIVAIEHRREGVALEVADTEVELTVVTRNEQHCLRLIDALEAHGYPVERLR